MPHSVPVYALTDNLTSAFKVSFQLHKYITALTLLSQFSTKIFCAFLARATCAARSLNHDETKSRARKIAKSGY
jgi:hypothetical protein